MIWCSIDPGRLIQKPDQVSGCTKFTLVVLDTVYLTAEEVNEPGDVLHPENWYWVVSEEDSEIHP